MDESKSDRETTLRLAIESSASDTPDGLVNRAKAFLAFLTEVPLQPLSDSAAPDLQTPSVNQ